MYTHTHTHTHTHKRRTLHSLADRALPPAGGATDTQTTISSTDHPPLTAENTSTQSSSTSSGDGKHENFDPDTTSCDRFQTSLTSSETGLNATLQVEGDTGCSSADVEEEVQVNVAGKGGVSLSKTTPTFQPRFDANEGAGNVLKNEESSRQLLPACVTVTTAPSVQGDTGGVRSVRDGVVSGGGESSSNEESRGRSNRDPTFPYSPPLPVRTRCYI